MTPRRAPLFILHVGVQTKHLTPSHTSAQTSQFLIPHLMRKSHVDIKVGLKRRLISERLFDLNLRCSDEKSRSFSYWCHQPMPLDLEGSPSNGQDRWCQLEEWRKRLRGVDKLKLISPFEISKGRFQKVAHGFNPYLFS